MSIGILGAGLSGLSASYHLGDMDNVILERDGTVGGVAGSFKKDGFTFDYGPHIIYSKSEYVKDLYVRLLGNNLILDGVRNNMICTLGAHIPFPFEANLLWAPPHVREECVLGLLERERQDASNFSDWISQTFGAGIAKYYMVPYNQKLWKYDLEKMSTKWIADRVVVPSVRDVVKGAFSPQEKRFGPNASFWYPKVGGTGAISEAFASNVRDLRLNTEVMAIDIRKPAVLVKTNEGDYSFERVLSSIPLPDLVEMLSDCPTDVWKASRELVYNSLVCVFIGTDRANLPNWTAAYIPDKKVNFHRISFPQNFSPFTVPTGKGAINVEITCEMGSKIDAPREAAQAIDGLVEIDVLPKNEKLRFIETRVKKYAYTIYDLNREKNVMKIREFLSQHNISTIGRFGEWEYHNTDHVVLSGKRAADAIPK